MRPNVLFFTSHDLGRHLGCYGQPTVSSPALDRLAQEGILFENSFCTAPQCSPSRAALHTGRHAHSVGMLGLAHNPFNWRLHPGEKHIARLLAEAGYDTGLCGVQHLTRSQDAADLGYAFYDATDALQPAPELAERAAAFLRDPGRHQRPFYLEVGFFETHRPYDWGGAAPDDRLGVQVPAYLPDSSEARAEFAALQGAVRRMDQAVGRILHVLDEAGLAGNTWVIFTVDHGLAMPRAKCTLYDPGLATALIMRLPAAGNGFAGRRFSELISHVDVVPTLLEGLGLPLPTNLHGRSFWPLLRGQSYQPNRLVFAEKTFHTAYEPMRGLRTERHKFIANFEVDTLVNVPDDVRLSPIYPQMLAELAGQRHYFELYDLEEDPGERVNLAPRPELQPLLDDLKDQLLDWMVRTGDPLLEGPVASPYYRQAVALLRKQGQPEAADD